VARAAADTTLKDDINAEAEARTTADETLQANIDTEAEASGAADELLQTAIDTATAARVEADEALQASIDTHGKMISNRYNNIVFVTSVTGNGQLSSWPEAGGKTGLEAADAVCQALADDAQLPGTFKAWLSDATTGASQRLVHSSVPYVRVDGVQIADSWKDLTDGILDAPLSVTEDGQEVDDVVQVLTGTEPNGDSVGTEGSTCNNWATDDSQWHKVVGNLQQPHLWTHGGYSGLCSDQGHIYCFQQDGQPLDTYDADADGTSTRALSWVWPWKAIRLPAMSICGRGCLGSSWGLTRDLSRPAF
jgi:hypothetical protein